uniref:Si:ch73-29c22.1 n=1 Tax=Acanthochromis polyacanthus TaxID=80966 RepID=A0A3Q1FK64_9TELE
EAWTQDDPSCLVEQFCPEYKEQRTSARGNVAVGTLDGLIYTVGGEDSIRCYSSVEVCLVAMDQYLCAIGGHDGITAINAVEYDPKMNTWTKQAAMLTRRTKAVAAVLDGYLVIGEGDGDMALNSPVERYNPVDGTWSICAHMLSPRENAGCTVYLRHIYVAGGKDELNLELCAAERFNPETMRWTPVKRMRSKRQMSLVVFNGALLAVGVSDGTTNLKTIEAYSHEHFGSMKSKHPGGRVAVLC